MSMSPCRLNEQCGDGLLNIQAKTVLSPMTICLISISRCVNCTVGGKCTLIAQEHYILVHVHVHVQECNVLELLMHVHV